MEYPSLKDLIEKNPEKIEQIRQQRRGEAEKRASDYAMPSETNERGAILDIQKEIYVNRVSALCKKVGVALIGAAPPDLRIITHDRVLADREVRKPWSVNNPKPTGAFWQGVANRRLARKSIPAWYMHERYTTQVEIKDIDYHSYSPKEWTDHHLPLALSADGRIFTPDGPREEYDKYREYFVGTSENIGKVPVETVHQGLANLVAIHNLEIVEK